jgi:hypothetical protein
VVTEPGIGNTCWGAIRVAVLPALTFSFLRKAICLGDGVFWGVAIAIAMTSAPVLADRAVAGGGFPSVLATAQSDLVGGATRKAGNGQRSSRVAKQKSPRSESGVRPKGKAALLPKPEAELRQTALRRTAKPKRPDTQEATIASNDRSSRMEECRHGINSVLQPSRLIKLAEECEREFPASQFAGELRHIATGARQALEIQRSTGLSGDFFEDSVGDTAYRENLGKAVRGDKDAAYRIAVAYRAGISGVVASPRRMEQWLRFSAELGSGQASWELAEFYNYGGFVADAARFEKKALDLGYRPPFRLPTRGY